MVTAMILVKKKLNRAANHNKQAARQKQVLLADEYEMAHTHGKIKISYYLN